MLQQVVGVGVHVAHQYLMAITANKIANVGKLAGTRSSAQCQMHHDYHQRISAFAKTNQNGAAASRPGQWMVFYRPWAQAAEHAVAVLAKMPEVAIELLIPVRERPELGKVFDLIDVARSQAAAIGFLECDQIEVAQQVADLLQVTGTAVVRQQVLPATCQVMPIALGTDTDLNVETEQPQPTICR